jgi:hypothetical protein
MPSRSSLWKTFLNLITSFRESEYTITLAIFIGIVHHLFPSFTGSSEAYSLVGMLKRTDVIVAYNNAVLRRSLERR